MSRLGLDALLEDEKPLAEQLREDALAFAAGRGQVLAVAIGVAVFCWWSLTALRGLIERRAKKKRGVRIASTRFRLFLYAHQLITFLVVGVALLMTFSAFGDYFMVTVVIIAIALTALWLRRALPQFIEEAKLLLGVGAVREGERIVYNGLPYKVASINVYSILRNPELEGFVRLPLKALVGMASRPANEGEPWFPSRPGDWVFLPGDLFAQVLRQTQEFVRFSVRGGMDLTMPTMDYVSSGTQNITGGESFFVTAQFGVAYDHIGLDDAAMSAAFARECAERLSRAPFAEHIISVDADFAEAGAHSLDWIVFVKIKSEAAPYFFAARRMIQKACVAVCVREGWSIPFPQLQVHHSPAGSEAPHRVEAQLGSATS